MCSAKVRGSDSSSYCGDNPDPHPPTAHHAVLGHLWLHHFVHLLSATSEAQAVGLGGELCAGIFVYRAALVGGTGEPTELPDMHMHMISNLSLLQSTD